MTPTEPRTVLRLPSSTPLSSVSMADTLLDDESATSTIEMQRLTTDDHDDEFDIDERLSSEAARSLASSLSGSAADRVERALRFRRIVYLMLVAFGMLLALLLLLGGISITMVFVFKSGGDQPQTGHSSHSRYGWLFVAHCNELVMWIGNTYIGLAM
jgi:hypothetical protein